MIIKRIVREPLLHFFLLGAAIFVVFGWLNRSDLQAADKIVVDEVRIADLVARFERTWQRPPGPGELHGLIDSWVREEILYREGLAMGLDLDDPIVRRRIAQKMEFLADGLVPDTPDERDLQNWLDQNADDYRVPPTFSFRQVYFDPERHGDDLRSMIAATRERLLADETVSGDPTLLPAELHDVDARRIARVFGTAFASRVTDLPVGAWSGPVQSDYGVHFVHIGQRRDGRMPALEEVRRAVERDLMNSLSNAANEAFYQSLRERYTVLIEAGPHVAESRR